MSDGPLPLPLVDSRRYGPRVGVGVGWLTESPVTVVLLGKVRLPRTRVDTVK